MHYSRHLLTVLVACVTMLTYASTVDQWVRPACPLVNSSKTKNMTLQLHHSTCLYGCAPSCVLCLLAWVFFTCVSFVRYVVRCVLSCVRCVGWRPCFTGAHLPCSRTQRLDCGASAWRLCQQRATKKCCCTGRLHHVARTWIGFYPPWHTGHARSMITVASFLRPLPTVHAAWQPYDVARTTSSLCGEQKT